MDTTFEERQNDQSQKKQGPISHLINSISNLRGANGLLSRSVGRVAPRVAFQAGRSLITFLITSPWFWAIVGILVVFVFVFTIVFS